MSITIGDPVPVSEDVPVGRYSGHWTEVWLDDELVLKRFLHSGEKYDVTVEDKTWTVFPGDELHVPEQQAPAA